MLILEIFKNEKIRNHLFNNFNHHYFMGNPMDASWISNIKIEIKLMFVK